MLGIKNSILGTIVGEMEKDTTISHGASATTKERLCDVSDKYKMAVCKCGKTANYNLVRQEFYCPVCPSKEIGAVTIPYVLKYNQNLMGPGGMDLSFGVTETNIIYKRNETKNMDEDYDEDTVEENEENDENPEDDDGYTNDDNNEDENENEEEEDYEEVDEVDDDINEDYY